MLNRIRRGLRSYQPPTLEGDWPDAAILVPLTSGIVPKLLLTRRADALATHAGEVAFPGGKRDPEDASLLDTALRETSEEIGIQAAQLEVLGSLRPRVSKLGIKVTPYVGLLSEEARIVVNPAEIAATFEAPLDHFRRREELRIDTRMFRGVPRDIPHYEYEGHQVWGLTAVFIVDLLNVVFDFGIDLRR